MASPILAASIRRRPGTASAPGFLPRPFGITQVLNPIRRISARRFARSSSAILIFLIAAVTIFLPAGKGDRLYWLLLVLGGLMLLAYGVAYNYYLFSFALGEFSKGVSFRIGWAGILYDCLMYLSWIPFIILRNHYLGGRSTQPIFGTNLDEDQGRKD